MLVNAIQKNTASVNHCKHDLQKTVRHCFCLLHLSKYNSFPRKSQSNSDIYFRTPGGGRGAAPGGAESGRKAAISAFISASKKLLIIFTKMKCSFHIALIYCNRAQEKAPDTLSFTSFISFFSTNRNASRPETGGFRFETYPLFLILSSAGVANRQCGRPKAIAFAHSDLYPLCRGVFNFRKYFSSPVER